MKKLYFLGPNGTYSEFAANKIKNILQEDLELFPVSTIAKAVDMVNNDIGSYGILPIENSIEGIVRPTIDSLFDNNVQINAQVEIEIKHCLFSKGKKENIKHIISHPQALSQCQRYILQNFDSKIELIEAKSTAAAAKELLTKNISHGAIASFEVGNSLGLNLIDVNIGDVEDNKTRFVLVSKNDLVIAPKTRTSVVFNTKNQPGALLEILNIFKKYDLNLIYLESRPSKKVFGEYNFFADIDKGIDQILPALNEVRAICNFYKYLGSYPSV